MEKLNIKKENDVVGCLIEGIFVPHFILTRDVLSAMNDLDFKKGFNWHYSSYSDVKLGRERNKELLNAELLVFLYNDSYVAWFIENGKPVSYCSPNHVPSVRKAIRKTSIPYIVVQENLVVTKSTYNKIPEGKYANYDLIYQLLSKI